MKFTMVSDTPFHELHYRSSGRNGESRELVLPFFRAKVESLPDGVPSFVVTSDLQGREIDKSSNRLVGEAVAEELEILHEIGEVPEVSFIALAGDLYDHPELHKLGGTGNVTSVWNSFAEKFDQVIGVLGNHDIVDNAEMAANTVILDGTTATYKGIRIGGVSGIVGRSDRNQRKTSQDFLKYLSKAAHAKNDLLLLHQGPYDEINDQIGDPEITDYLKKKQVGTVIFGHCHWANPFQVIGKNQVLNVDNRLYVVTAEE